MGAEEEWGESGCWGKERFSPALVVAARMVYRGTLMFDKSGIAPVNELQN